MADGLRTFGMFLRNVGAGLNPDVAAGLRQEQALQAQDARDRLRRENELADAETNRKMMIGQLLLNSAKGMPEGDPRRAELVGAIQNLNIPELTQMTTGNATLTSEGPVRPDVLLPSQRKMKRVNAIRNNTVIPAILDETSGNLLEPGTGQPMPDALLQTAGDRRGDYFTLVDIVKDGKVFKVPFNHRTSEYHWNEQQEVGAGGALLSPKDPSMVGATTAAKESAKMQTKRTFNMAGINDLLDRSKQVLEGTATGKKPTASGIGALSDMVAGFFGASLDGSSEARMMESLGGALTSKMPRMEGPQSDRDTLMYREMAGKIGDRTVPVKERLAALEEVRRIWAKYEHLNFGKNQNNQDAAIEWLRNNPNHPQAQAVRAKLQQQGVIR